MNIILASIEDAECILLLQKLAYHSEAEIYNDFSIPPLHQTFRELIHEFTAKTILKAILKGQIIGSVRAWEKNGTCYVERLMVHPDFRGKGIGAKLMAEIEGLFPDVKRWELFTGHRSEANIRLYQRLGYRIFNLRRMTDALSFVDMEKLKV